MVGDVDDQVLLSADHGPAADLDRDRPGVDPARGRTSMLERAVLILPASAGQTPRDFPMISFMISVVPP